jgi:catalase
MLRDGSHLHAVYGAIAPYRPSSLHGENPFEAGDEQNAFLDAPVRGRWNSRDPANRTPFDGQIRLSGAT